MKKSHSDKPRLLIDIDGVLRDFIAGLTTVYCQEYPDHQVKKVVSRDLHEFFPIGHDIYPFMDVSKADQILFDAPAIGNPGKEMANWEDKYQLIIVTAQPPEGRFATLKWLGKHKIPSNEIRITHQKDAVYGAVLLDDFVHNLEAFANTGRLAVCFDQPWNQSWQGPRVKSLSAFFELVNNHFGKNQQDGIISPDTFLA